MMRCNPLVAASGLREMAIAATTAMKITRSPVGPRSSSDLWDVRLDPSPFFAMTDFGQCPYQRQGPSQESPAEKQIEDKDSHCVMVMTPESNYAGQGID
jgi:hypothetical protein